MQWSYCNEYTMVGNAAVHFTIPDRQINVQPKWILQLWSQGEHIFKIKVFISKRGGMVKIADNAVTWLFNAKVTGK